jgi:S1-C subfamily serine protease
VESKVPVVAGVAERSSAARAGLLAGDRIVAVNGTEVETLEGFRERTRDLLLRDAIRLRVERKGEQVMLVLPPAQSPSR